MPSALRTVVEKVATTTGTPISRGKARIMNEPLWSGGGFRFWVDGAHINSQANDNDPATGSTVNDLGQGTIGTWTVPTAGAVDYAANGWDFTPATAIGSPGTAPRLDIPASVAADIWGDGTVSQYFGVVLYVRLQAAADWNPVANVLPYIHFDTQAGYFTDPSMMSISSLTDASGNKLIRIVRAVATNARDQIDILVPAAAFAKFASIAMWRDATGTHARLTYDDGASGAQVATAITGLGNATGNFSTRVGVIGLVNGYAGFANSGAARKWKFYAGGVENLRTSGRDFGAVLDSDWIWRLAMARAGIYA